ncbi:hypothetical protein ACQSSU_20635 [Micromonospora echinospora]
MTFQISVTTLKADTEESLYPTRYFDIAIDVRDTLTSRVKRGASTLNNFFVGASVGIAALLTVVLTYLGYRRRLSGVGEPSAEEQPAAQPTPTVRPAQPPPPAQPPAPRRKRRKTRS